MSFANLESLRQLVRPPCPVVDIHVHPLDCFGAHRVTSPEEDAGLLVAAAQRAGITKMVVFSLHSTCPREPTPGQCREANDYALRLAQIAPEVFLPFCYVNPAYPGPAVEEIGRCVGEGKMVGIKLWVARRATDPGLDPIMEAAAQLQVPVLQHAWRKTTGNLPGESTPADVADLARRHPEVPIIMAHLNGCNPRGIEDVVDCDNVCVDVSGGDPESGIVEQAVRRLGAGRVLYGSDAPIRHFSVCLAKVLAAEIEASAKVDILWNNAARILPPWAGVPSAAG